MGAMPFRHVTKSIAPMGRSYKSLMARMVGENPNVKWFTTNVALSVVKRGLTIPCRWRRRLGPVDEQSRRKPQVSFL